MNVECYNPTKSISAKMIPFRTGMTEALGSTSFDEVRLQKHLVSFTFMYNCM